MSAFANPSGLFRTDPALQKDINDPFDDLWPEEFVPRICNLISQADAKRKSEPDEASKLFFPTVHIHDGKVHKTAAFDHALYCQGVAVEKLMRWQETPKLAGSFMKVEQCQGLIDKEAHVYRMRLVGRRDNQDILV